MLRAAEVAAGPIQSIADIVEDPQFIARDMFERCTLPDGSPVRMPAMVPKLEATPGRTRWLGPELGAHTEEVLESWLGLDAQSRAALARDGITAVQPCPDTP